MKRPSRLKQPRLLRRDWIGDAVLTLIAGGVLLAAVFLPWVNDDAPGRVNFSLHGATEFNGVLQTQWGWPALGLAVAVRRRGRGRCCSRARAASRSAWARWSRSLGVAVFGVAQDAAAHIGYYDPGVGMYLTTLVGVLLVPDRPRGGAGGAGSSLRAEGRASDEPPASTPPPPTAPPAPESAPPS